ncbi:hypothetical protein LTR48_001459 [Friedmanniomyces endolithicus]|uniref:Histone H2A/H2B/H3 domain-containing protein n=1 Tax=Rachicladosporium monterosium TaxID=1507873 RepID=A0ABR0LDK3_9PEZI|nr:hypothetical protein LTR29_007899 [Friedmanniomyces endolithicus]KAK1088549.1 hypothetical protein LTR48_001459 [Friedmanniomyces endolithicus]KAK5146454.1 hypothetical protein LTR32_001950 [Rachicladosporium monterosium]
MAATAKAKPKAKTAATKARRSTTPKKAAAKPKAISKSPPKKPSPKKSPPKKASPKKPKATTKVAKATKASTKTTNTGRGNAKKTCFATRMKLRSAEPRAELPYVDSKEGVQLFAEEPENMAKHPGLITSAKYLAAVAELKAARREEYDAQRAPEVGDYITRRANAQVRGMTACHNLGIMIMSSPSADCDLVGECNRVEVRDKW